VSKPSVRVLLLILGIAVLAAACASSDAPLSDAGEAPTTAPTTVGGVEAARPNPDSVYNPVFEGEELPEGFRQLLGRDDIFPVYDPTFVAPDQVDWPEDGLVVGVDLEGEARAYPVGFMTRREMVVDNHRGIPTLVTW
jgi:hypothetical protein